MTAPFVPRHPACRLPLHLLLATLLSGCGAADQAEATRAWIAQARREADSRVPAPAHAQPEQTDAAALPLTDTPTDPFGMAQRRAAHRQASARNDDRMQQAGPAGKSAPHIRVLGTLVQETSAYAVLQVDGRSLRVRVGDELPAGLGRVVRIDEQSVQVAHRGATQILAVGSGATQEMASNAPPSADKPRQPRQRHWVRP